jgi:hypothetical protein
MISTARKFVESNESAEFKAACDRVRAHRAGTKGFATVEPTVRQARKWRAHKGIAWKEGRAR